MSVTDDVVRIAHQNGLLKGLPLEPTEAEIFAFIERVLKRKKFDKVSRNKLIEALVKVTNLGKRDLQALFKKAQGQKLREASEMPCLDVNIESFDEMLGYCLKCISNANARVPFIFHWAGKLARIAYDEDGAPYVDILNLAKFTHELNSITKWKETKFSGDEMVERYVPAPKEVVQHVFNALSKDYPPLRRVLSVPTFTTTKKLTDPGYSNGLFFHPLPGLWIPKVPNKPTPDQVKSAVNLIAELFADVPLDGLSRKELMKKITEGEEVPSFAHLLSYGLSSIVRELIAGPVPGHLFRKDKPRSGATLAASTMETIATCQPPSPFTLPSREEEIQKTLLSVFMAGAPYALFDNIKGGSELDSDALAAAMTAYPKYKGRLLSTNSIASAPAGCVFGFTGNRSALSPQLAERLLLIDIDPKMENPATRSSDSFKYDIASEVRKRPAELYHALLIIVQNWIANGCPEWRGTPLGGFGRHAAIVGGILDEAGVKGFMSNRDRLNDLVKADDPVLDFMDALIAEHRATAKPHIGTLFKVGKPDIGLPKALKGSRVVSIGKVLDDAQLALNGFGYKHTSDGEVFYPPASNSTMAQRMSGLVGTVREGDGDTAGRWTLQAVPDLPRKFGKLYRLEHVSPAEIKQTEVSKRRMRRRRAFG